MAFIPTIYDIRQSSTIINSLKLARGSLFFLTYAIFYAFNKIRFMGPGRQVFLI